MGWAETIGAQNIGMGFKKATSFMGARVVEPAAKFLDNGKHAQQVIPAQHRALSAGGMFVGWVVGDKLRDIMFGVNQVSEGEYEEVKREDVPAPLRFLHKTIDWNPHSDEPNQQWKKLAHQLLPAIGAGVGTVFGSMYAFERNGKAQTFSGVKSSKNPLTMMQADTAAQYAQARNMRVLTAAFGGFSTASMLTIVYGAMLNLAFATANGAKIFTNDLAKGNQGVAGALGSQLGSVGEHVKSAVRADGKLDEKWAEGFVKKVLNPLFGEDLKNPEAQARVRGKIQAELEKSFKNSAYKDLPPDDLAKVVSGDMKKIFGDSKEGFKEFDRALKELGLDAKKAKLGNGIPIVREFHEFLAKHLGIGKSINAQSFADRVAVMRTGASPDMSPAGAGARG